MSRSSISIQIKYSMLDGRTECDPAMADTSAGHSHFTWSRKLRSGGPGSWYFESPEYSRAKIVDLLVEETMKEFAAEKEYRNLSPQDLLRNAYTYLMQKAEQHVLEVHGTPVREQPEDKK